MAKHLFKAPAHAFGQDLLGSIGVGLGRLDDELVVHGDAEKSFEALMARRLEVGVDFGDRQQHRLGGAALYRHVESSLETDARRCDLSTFATLLRDQAIDVATEQRL